MKKPTMIHKMKSSNFLRPANKLKYVMGSALFFLGISVCVQAQGYYYPQQQPQYPPGYYYPQQQPQYYPRQPQYPQYPQQQQQRQQATPQAAQSTPQRRSSQRDTSGDAPVQANLSGIDLNNITTYTWDSRDTLAHLARAAGVSNNQILALNNLSVSQLRSGQVLRVPPLAQTTPSLDIVRDPAGQRAREIWRGVRGKKQVALTFDAGGVATGLDDLLKNLTEANAAATFFATGQFAEKYKEETEKIHKAGYRIYNHSWSHPKFTSISDEEMRNELAKTDDAISAITGLPTKPYWRPPFGDRNQQVLRTTADAGYISIYWTHDSHDSVGEKKSAEFVANRVLNPPNAKSDPDSYLDGAIILMHVGEQGTADAIPEIVKGLRARGFTLVTVDEILQP